MRKKNKINYKNNLILTTLKPLRVKLQLNLHKENKNGKWKDYRSLKLVKKEIFFKKEQNLCQDLLKE